LVEEKGDDGVKRYFADCVRVANKSWLTQA
jgi:hypothetical protein